MVYHSRIMDTATVNKIRKDFPILEKQINGFNLIYFDNAATTHIPKQVMEEIIKFYSEYNSNTHSGIHTLSYQATKLYEETRELLAKHFNVLYQNVIFTKNATESLNLAAHIASNVLSNNDCILITEVEHHSNVVPWICIKKKLKKYGINVNLKYIQINQNGILNINNLDNLINKNVKILAFTIASNVFGTEYDVYKIIAKARSINPNIIVIVDAAQAVPHTKIDFTKLQCDFLAFSAHKMCGPKGVGVLLISDRIKDSFDPFISGGGTVQEVKKNKVIFKKSPYKFEAGTPNICGVIAFKKTLEYLNSIGFENIKMYLKFLNNYFQDKISPIAREHLILYSPRINSVNDITKKEIPIFSFNLKHIHSHDVAYIFDRYGIATRAGHHCAKLAMRKIKANSTVRASLYFYNTIQEIDTFVKVLEENVIRRF